MSWVRWGSKCQGSIPRNPIDDSCQEETCPGSSVYVYGSSEGIECCECDMTIGNWFIAKNEEEMVDHLIEHKKRGDHIRPSLLIKPKKKS